MRALQASTRRGFTLIELLIVIGIIALLVGITLVVGNQVMTGGRKSITLDTIRVLDQSLDAYIHKNEGNPPPTWSDPLQPNVKYLAADARDMVNPPNEMINGLTIYMLQAGAVPDAKGILDKVPSKMIKVFNPDGAILGQPQKRMMIVDGWGQPIRYVHPAFHGNVYDDIAATNPNPATQRSTDQVLGALNSPQAYSIAQVRRNHVVTLNGSPADSDGGTCPGARPYFYSVGQDGLVGLKMNGNNVDANYNLDNVYTTQPAPVTK